MREKFQKIVDSRFGVYADKFCNSVWYIVAIGAVCVLCHTLDIPVVGAALLCLLLIPALLFCKNSFVLMPFLMMCSFVISEDTMPQSGYYNTPLNISILCILLAFVFVALVFNVIVFGKWKVIFKKSYLTVSLSLLTAVLLIGGVGAPAYNFNGVGTALAIALTMFFPYAMLVNCGEYNGRKTVEYFAWALIVAAVVIFAAVIKQYIKYDLNVFTITSKQKTDCLVFGYAISNTAAAIVLLAIPITFYMVYLYKHGYLFLIAIALELLTILLTFSRASLVVALPGTLIVAIALCFKKKTGKLYYIIAFCIAAVAVLGVAIYFRRLIIDKVTALFANDSTGSGRTRIWKVGFDSWKNNPIFGIGLWFLPDSGRRFYSFHCTPLTYLFCAGVIGLLAYIYHRYKTVRLVFSAKLNLERVFLALTVLAMLCNALLDIGMTSPPHLLYYAMMLALIECDVHKTKKEAQAAQDNSIAEDVSQSDETLKTESDNVAAQSIGENNERM